MAYKKLIIFIIALTVYINYNNYFKVDTIKKYESIAALKDRIAQEKSINKSNKNNMRAKLKVNFDTLMFQGKRFSYSQAMGNLQNQITKSAKDICHIKNIKWAQSAQNKLWYDILRINVVLECTPDHLLQFKNNLKAHKKLYKIENFRAIKNRHQKLTLYFQVVAYRIKNGKK